MWRVCVNGGKGRGGEENAKRWVGYGHGWKIRSIGPAPHPPRPAPKRTREDGTAGVPGVESAPGGVGGWGVADRRPGVQRLPANPRRRTPPPPRIGRPGADQDGQTEPRPGQRMRSAPAQAWIRPKRGAVRRESGLGLKMRQNRPKILQKYRLHRLNKTNHHHLTELTCFTFRWLNASSPESSTG